MQEMIRLENPEPFVPVDQWVETEEDKYLIHGKGYIAIPVLSKMYGFSDVQYISYFYLRKEDDLWKKRKKKQYKKRLLR